MKIIYIVLLFSLIACNNLRNEAVKIKEIDIDVEKVLGNVDDKLFPLSELADKGEYIPLETTPQSLINPTGQFFRCNVSKKYIVADMNIFNRADGRFIKKLGKRGPGPQEYTDVCDVGADEERKEFYVLSADNKIVVYDYEGNFKDSFTNPGMWNLINLGNGNLFLGRDLSFSEEYIEYCVVNVDTKEVLYKQVASKEATDNHTLKYAPAHNCYWSYNNQLCYYEVLTDSLFVINKKTFRPEGRGRLRLGDLKLTSEKARIPVFQRDFATYKIVGFTETDNYLYVILYSYKMKSIANRETVNYLIVYSKEKQQVIHVNKSPINKSLYLNNDIDGAPVLYFKPVYGEASAYVLLSPEKMKKAIAETNTDFYKPDCAEHFREIAMSIGDDDNGALVIYTLK